VDGVSNPCHFLHDKLRRPDTDEPALHFLGHA
jgi:hypothetical protein